MYDSFSNKDLDDPSMRQCKALKIYSLAIRILLFGVATKITLADDIRIASVSFPVDHKMVFFVPCTNK